MDILALSLFLLSLSLAFANGANDVSKGIATLVGAGLAAPRRAALWGAAWTAAGAFLAALGSAALLKVFSGKGILGVPTSDPRLLLAAGLGAVGFLGLATRVGMPVSTTHALVGGLCGVGLAAGGLHGVRWEALGGKVALPLAASPLMSLGLFWAAFPAVRRLTRWGGERCVCAAAPGVALASGLAPIQLLDSVTVADRRRCGPKESAWAALPLGDALHWLSAGLTCLARGVNDTPKIVALGLAAAGALGLGADRGFLLAAAAMGLGSAWAGARVTETLAEKVARIEPEEGLGANLVTAALVGAASRLGLPVSTTHVAGGAVVGAGLRRGEGSVRWGVVGEMLLAWLVTLPAAALLAALAYKLLV